MSEFSSRTDDKQPFTFTGTKLVETEGQRDGRAMNEKAVGKEMGNFQDEVTQLAQFLESQNVLKKEDKKYLKLKVTDRNYAEVFSWYKLQTGAIILDIIARAGATPRASSQSL